MLVVPDRHIGCPATRMTVSRTWSYPEGMKGYLKDLLADTEPVAPIFDGEKYVQEANGFAVGEGEFRQ